jgi:3-dehydroquinate synthetase
MPTLHVQLRGEPAYPVHIGQGLLPRLGSLASKASLRPSRVLLVSDRNVPAVHAARIAKSFVALNAQVFGLSLRASERAKSVQTLARIWSAASEAQLSRDDCIVSLAGGCLGDVVGLAASTYRRGIRFVQCPTTLLACVDASVGGKTAINLVPARAGAPLVKNIIGAFHQPTLVVSDVLCLASLPAGTLSDGLAECIKHACLARHAHVGAAKAKSLWRLTQRAIPRVLAHDASALTSLIACNVAIKASIASPDPRELASDKQGGRALLNLGHTFGHVLEALPAGPRRPALSHGQAISLGMVAASHASLAMGLCSPALVEDVMDMLALAQLPTQLAGPLPRGTTPATLSKRMLATDKKVRAGQLRIIVPIGDAPGACKVIANPPAHALHAAWQSIA